jgi:hypothetical protein
VTKIDQHSSLLQHETNYGRKNLYSTGHRTMKHSQKFFLQKKHINKVFCNAPPCPCNFFLLGVILKCFKDIIVTMSYP